MNRNTYRIISRYTDDTEAYEHLGAYELRDAQAIARYYAKCNVQKHGGTYRYERNVACVIRDSGTYEYRVIAA